MDGQAAFIAGRELTENLKLTYKITTGAAVSCSGEGPGLPRISPGIGNTVDEARIEWFKNVAQALGS